MPPVIGLDEDGNLAQVASKEAPDEKPCTKPDDRRCGESEASMRPGTGKDESPATVREYTLEGLTIKGNLSLLGLASLQGQLLETLQCLDGSTGIIQSFHIHLNGLSALAVACISNGNG